MIFFNNLLSVLTFFTVIINLSESLECYVCTNQDQNHEKCLNTIKTCEPEEDMCLSEITPPYWVEGGIKQYYVSKRCATRATCDAVKTKTMPYCTYLWYQDWKCAECCLGDRCNYYITMGSSAVKSNLIVLLGCIAILIGFHITKTNLSLYIQISTVLFLVISKKFRPNINLKHILYEYFIILYNMFNLPYFFSLSISQKNPFKPLIFCNIMLVMGLQIISL
ncbi:hypothetical protein AGLY_005117 [Aphis glycines]|uniref:UPAR/Ly6 domain-containing protein n=1 Tax=Aphis glycines TaxID=307491 RepID=A0A6G0TVT3_APHGL|nr:hypothetical protein AGLY_005117 [Aphis glycines]